jgi:hypothetical protein
MALGKRIRTRIIGMLLLNIENLGFSLLHKLNALSTVLHIKREFYDYAFYVIENYITLAFSNKIWNIDTLKNDNTCCYTGTRISQKLYILFIPSFWFVPVPQIHTQIYTRACTYMYKCRSGVPLEVECLGQEIRVLYRRAIAIIIYRIPHSLKDKEAARRGEDGRVTIS